MQRCADHVRAGYFLHTTGVVPLDRAPAFARKFRDLYLVHLDRNSRYRRKGCGLGNAHLLLWADASLEGHLVFVLLVTHGDHAAARLENLSDARTRPLEITGYELVRQTRGGSAVPAWSWRQTEITYLAWRDRIRRVIRSHDDLALRQAWYSLHRAPGFAPIRRPVRKLIKLAKDEYNRVRSDNFPFAPERIRYVARLPNGGLPLSAVIAGAAPHRIPGHQVSNHQLLHQSGATPEEPTKQEETR